MRQSYTLVIPTYNRPESLARLLRYLCSQGADFPIHVLDSSRPAGRAANRKAVDASGLNCRHVHYPEDIHPFDKFQHGIGAVQTPICALCADDDIPVLDGTRASVAFLLNNGDYSAAHGYYFQFAMGPGEMRLAGFTYYTPSIDMGEPLARVHALMRHYQALTYGTYRTEVLRTVFDRVRPAASILARELLSSVLTVVQGKVVRLPVVYQGRSLGPSGAYQNWHPLEWLLRDGKSMFEEYASYREILAREVLRNKESSYSEVEAFRIIDMIHMQYLACHLPGRLLDYMNVELMRGKSPEEIFRSLPVTMGLVRAANQFVPLEESLDPARQCAGTASAGGGVAAPAGNGAWKRQSARAELVGMMDRQTPGFASLLRRIKSAMVGARLKAHRDLPASQMEPLASVSLASALDTPVRRYQLAPEFIAPPVEFGVSVRDDEKRQLVETLDDYRD